MHQTLVPLKIALRILLDEPNAMNVECWKENTTNHYQSPDFQGAKGDKETVEVAERRRNDMKTF